jgi:putative Mg2+ transporter-C (MgtC) family protein
VEIEIGPPEIAIRLLLTLVAGAIVGINRSERGRAAGFRTTILVCLTASASMILGNLLLGTTGRPFNSFVTMDVMRLPLGILTGMGFIGAGAILHRANMVTGVTTAATLWFTTVMGFCFGAGEFLLGAWMLGLSILVLWCMQWVEARWKQRQEGTLMVLVEPNGPSHTADRNHRDRRPQSWLLRGKICWRRKRMALRCSLASRPGGCFGAAIP